MLLWLMALWIFNQNQMVWFELSGWVGVGFSVVLSVVLELELLICADQQPEFGNLGA